MAKVLTTFFYDIKRKETYELDLKTDDDIAFFVEMWEQDPADEREYTVSTCAPQLVATSIEDDKEYTGPNGEEMIVIVCDTDDEYDRFCKQFVDYAYVVVLRQSEVHSSGGNNVNADSCSPVR